VSHEEERYASLISLSDELARATAAEMVCAALTANAPRLVGAYDAAMFVRDESAGSEQNHFLPIGRAPGQPPVYAFNALWPISRPGLVNRATAQQPHAPYGALWDALVELKPGSVAHVPVGPRWLLVVLFRADDRQLTRDDWTVLASVAEQAAAANERLEALARVRELSLNDMESGLGNRRLVDLVLQHRFAGAVRGEPLSIVAIRALEADAEPVTHAGPRPSVRRVAELLRSQQRGSDVAAHLGDGLFVVILHGAGSAGAEAFLHRILLDLRGTDVASGVVTHGPGFSTPEDLLSAVLAQASAVPPQHDDAGAADAQQVTPAR
jgi:GGDEF domain-containing protein